MTDLNDWRLTYPGRELLFGTYATGFPFTAQVEVSAPEFRTGDAQHTTTDGTVFGYDQAGGMTLTFAVAIEKTRGRGDRWHENLDQLDVFRSAWAARSLRRKVGAVAELANLDRGRVVWGRPRNLKPRLDVVRRGWSELVCDFTTVDDLFYGLTEHETTLTVLPGAAGGFVFPIRFPWGTIAATRRTLSAPNHGTEDAPVDVVFQGPSTNPMVEVLDANGGVLWRIRLDGTLAYDQTATISSYPWRRGAWVNGGPASGRLRGDDLDTCRIPPGVWPVRYTATDPTGTSTATIRNRDAHASL